MINIYMSYINSWTRYSKPNRNSLQVTYDKGRDNVATLRSKLIAAYRKTKTPIHNLNEDLQRLKKNRSITLYYNIKDLTYLNKC